MLGSAPYPHLRPPPCLIPRSRPRVRSCRARFRAPTSSSTFPQLLVSCACSRLRLAPCSVSLPSSAFAFRHSGLRGAAPSLAPRPCVVSRAASLRGHLVRLQGAVPV